jgi:hypothetical protein
MIVVMTRTIVIGVLAALALAPSALAAPPTLGTVTQAAGKVTAAWTLPAGGQVWTVEVSRSSGVDSDGYFDADDVVDNDVFVDSRTTWTSDEVLAAGTYYVHVSGWDRNCATCPIPEWSSVRTVTVPAGTGGTTATTTVTTPATTGTTPSSPATAPASTPGATDSVGTTAAQPAPTASAAPVAVTSGTVSGATARLKGAVATVSFRVCGSGDVQVRLVARRGTRLAATVVTVPLTSGGCLAYRLGVTVPKGTGAATLSVDGATLKL